MEKEVANIKNKNSFKMEINPTKEQELDIAYWSIGWMTTKDGPGNRVIVYMQGCPVHCPWCHSPHARYDISPLLFQSRLCHLCGKCERVCPNHVHKITPQGHFMYRERCTQCGKCISACPHSDVSDSGGVLFLPTVRQGVGELFELLRPQLDIVRKSGGITLSGGEALMQEKAAVELLKLCKAHQIHTCVETSMLLGEDVYREAAKYVDCWLLGFREVYLPGLSDQETVRLNCKKHISIFRQESNPRLIARLPIIKGYTDKEELLHMLREILLENTIMELEILPCNPHMEHYYECMGEDTEIFVNDCIPDDAQIQAIMEYFVQVGIHTDKVN